MSDKMNDRIEELLKMLGDVDDFNREIIEKGSVKVEKDGETKKEDKKIEIKKVMSPREIVEKLNETVIGQDNVKKTLAVAFFKYLTERLNEDKLKEMGRELTKSNILLTGLSGNGKTYTIEQLCKILEMDYIVVNCASITSPGYKGGDIEDELKKLFDKCDNDLERIKKSVVILDEVIPPSIGPLSLSCQCSLSVVVVVNFIFLLNSSWLAFFVSDSLNWYSASFVLAKLNKYSELLLCFSW